MLVCLLTGCVLLFWSSAAVRAQDGVATAAGDADIRVDGDPTGVGATLARLSIWAPPEKIEKLESAYAKHVEPYLRAQGIRESGIGGRPTAPGVFSQLFELSSPAEVVEKRSQLQASPEWREALGRCHKIAQPSSAAGVLPFRFDLYSTPTGPGTTVVGGRGRGHWRFYGTRDGLPKGMVRSIIPSRIVRGTCGSASMPAGWPASTARSSTS